MSVGLHVYISDTQPSHVRRKWGAVGSGHARQVVARDTTAQGLLVHQNMGLHAVRQTHAEMVKEAKPQKHTYICSEERTVVHHAVLMQREVRAPQTSAH